MLVWEAVGLAALGVFRRFGHQQEFSWNSVTQYEPLPHADDAVKAFTRAARVAQFETHFRFRQEPTNAVAPMLLGVVCCSSQRRLLAPLFVPVVLTHEYILRIGPDVR